MYSVGRFTASGQKRRQILVEGVPEQRQEHDPGHHAGHGDAEVFQEIVMRTPVEHGDGIDGKERDEPQEKHDDRTVSRIVFEVFPAPLHLVELTGDELAAEEEPHEVGRRQFHDDTGDVDEQTDDRRERHTDTHVDKGRRHDEDDGLDGEQRHDHQEPFPGRPGPADHLLNIEVTERIEIQGDEREQEDDDEDP